MTQRNRRGAPMRWGSFSRRIGVAALALAATLPLATNAAYLNDPPLCDTSSYAVTWCERPCSFSDSVTECMVRQDYWCGNGLPGWPRSCVYEYCGGGCVAPYNGRSTCQIQPEVEVCGDAIDNDRNGCIDDGCPQFDACNNPCAAQCTAPACNPAQLATCSTPPEVCGDLVDNDCDGLMDEGCPPVAIDTDQVLYCYSDPGGTPVALADERGVVRWRAEYQPFGEENVLLEQVPNDKTFVGKTLDAETGLLYFGARFFDPSVGRFLSPDPVSAVDPATGEIAQDLLAQPQSLNAYAYAFNNPYRFVDPDGRLVRPLTPAEKAERERAAAILNDPNASDWQKFLAYVGLVAMTDPGVGPAAIGSAPAKAATAVPRLASLAARIGKSGIHPYRAFKVVAPWAQRHHLIPQRFAAIFGQHPDDMLAVVVTHSEHVRFTNAWQKAIPYGQGTAQATKEQIIKAAKIIYAEYPEILKALGIQ